MDAKELDEILARLDRRAAVRRAVNGADDSNDFDAQCAAEIRALDQRVRELENRAIDARAARSDLFERVRTAKAERDLTFGKNFELLERVRKLEIERDGLLTRIRVGVEQLRVAEAPEPCCGAWALCEKACVHRAEGWRMAAKRAEAAIEVWQREAQSAQEGMRQLEEKLKTQQSSAEPVYVIFDGPPGPEGGCFVEVETAAGKGVKAGEWTQCEKDARYWQLGPLYAAPPSLAAAPEAEKPKP